jgi:hypothetical protein
MDCCHRTQLGHADLPPPYKTVLADLGPQRRGKRLIRLVILGCRDDSSRLLCFGRFVLVEKRKLSFPRKELIPPLLGCLRGRLLRWLHSPRKELFGNGA